MTHAPMSTNTARLGSGVAALALAAVAGVAAAPASAADQKSMDGSSAYGIAAEGTLLNVDPTPHVVSTGKPVHEELHSIPASPLLDAHLVNLKAKPGKARAQIVQLNALEKTLEANSIVAKCKGGEGDSHLVKARVGGVKLKAKPEPNTTLSVPPAQLGLQGVADVKVTLNKQVPQPGGGITVTALEVKANLLAQNLTQTISVASVTCGAGNIGTEEPKPEPPDTSDPKLPTPEVPETPETPETPESPAPSPEAPDGEAPAPTPVPGDLPVTG